MVLIELNSVLFSYLQDCAQGMIKLMSPPPVVWHCSAHLSMLRWTMWQIVYCCYCYCLWSMPHWTIWQIVQLQLLCGSVKWRCVVFETSPAVFAVPKKFYSLFLYLRWHFWRQEKLEGEEATWIWPNIFMFLLLGEGSVRFQHNMLKPCRLNKDLFFGLVLASKLNNLQSPNFRPLGD